MSLARTQRSWQVRIPLLRVGEKRGQLSARFALRMDARAPEAGQFRVADGSAAPERKLLRIHLPLRSVVTLSPSS